MSLFLCCSKRQRLAHDLRQGRNDWANGGIAWVPDEGERGTFEFQRDQGPGDEAVGGEFGEGDCRNHGSAGSRAEGGGGVEVAGLIQENIEGFGGGFVSVDFNGVSPTSRERQSERELVQGLVQ